MRFVLFCDSPLGRLALVEEKEHITHLFLGQPILAGGYQVQETPLLQQAAQQLEEYWRGERKSFALPLAPKGTPFQRKVWAALQAIPYGETRSYQQVAQQVESPLGSRAVGMANNKNPIPLLIPCHRVVGKDGSLTGYALGLPAKEHLLKLEKGEIDGR